LIDAVLQGDVVVEGHARHPADLDAADGVVGAGQHLAAVGAGADGPSGFTAGFADHAGDDLVHHAQPIGIDIDQPKLAAIGAGYQQDVFAERRAEP
jgi:hypothetical protein